MAGFVSRDDRVGAYYTPMAQGPFRTMTLAIRAAGSGTDLVTAVRARCAQSIRSCRSST